MRIHPPPHWPAWWFSAMPAALLLALAAWAAPAHAKPQTEADYLHSYVALVCIRASYARLSPPAPHVLKLLDAEAWVFVEKGRQGPEVYATLHPLATEAGGAIPPEAAFRACTAWAHGPEATRHITRLLKAPAVPK